MNGCEAAGDLALIQPPLPLLYKLCCCNSSVILISPYEQYKSTEDCIKTGSPVASLPFLGSYNCEMVYCVCRKRKYFALLVIDDLSIEDENGDIPSRRNHVNWVRPWMARREERGVFHQLARELAVEDAGGYRDFFTVNSQQFEILFNAVSHRISKQDTKLRSSIKHAERLAVTLIYSATGETFKSLEYSFRISRTMISSIVIECAGYATLSSPPLLSY